MPGKEPLEICGGEEYNEATNTETINGVTVKVHSNGHKFYNISNKTSIDSYYNTNGSAWFYGIDTNNERIFLPRNKYFAIKGTENSLSVNVHGSGTSLGFSTGSDIFGICAITNNGVYMNYDADSKAIGTSVNGTASTIVKNNAVGLTTNSSLSGITGQVNTSNILKLENNKFIHKIRYQLFRSKSCSFVIR